MLFLEAVSLCLENLDDSNVCFVCHLMLSTLGLPYDCLGTFGTFDIEAVECESLMSLTCQLFAGVCCCDCSSGVLFSQQAPTVWLLPWGLCQISLAVSFIQSVRPGTIRFLHLNEKEVNKNVQPTFLYGNFFCSVSWRKRKTPSHLLHLRPDALSSQQKSHVLCT